MAAYEDESNWGKEMDREEHLTTFDGFYKLTKYGTVACVVLLALMGLFLL